MGGIPKDGVLVERAELERLRQFRADAVALLKHLAGAEGDYCGCDPDVGYVPCMDCEVRRLAAEEAGPSDQRAWTYEDRAKRIERIIRLEYERCAAFGMTPGAGDYGIAVRRWLLDGAEPGKAT